MSSKVASEEMKFYGIVRKSVEVNVWGFFFFFPPLTERASVALETDGQKQLSIASFLQGSAAFRT